MILRVACVFARVWGGLLWAVYLGLGFMISQKGKGENDPPEDDDRDDGRSRLIPTFIGRSGLRAGSRGSSGRRIGAI